MLTFNLRLTNEDAFDGSGDDDYINVYASRQDIILEGKAFLGTEDESFKAFLSITAQVSTKLYSISEYFVDREVEVCGSFLAP